MDISRIPLDDREELVAFFQTDEYKLALKYLRALKKDIVEELVDAQVESANLVYLKGKVDGADRLIRLLEDLRAVLK